MKDYHVELIIKARWDYIGIQAENEEEALNIAKENFIATELLSPDDFMDYATHDSEVNLIQDNEEE